MAQVVDVARVVVIGAMNELSLSGERVCDSG